MEMRSRRDALIANFTDYQNLLAGASPQLSGRFAYDLLSSTYAFPAADDMLASEIRRLLKRHKEEKATLDAQDWAERLRAWAAALPGGPVELAAWLLLARFITSGGEL